MIQINFDTDVSYNRRLVLQELKADPICIYNESMWKGFANLRVSPDGKLALITNTQGNLLIYCLDTFKKVSELELSIKMEWCP